LVTFFREQAAQYHEAAFLVKQTRARLLQLIEQKKRKALEGQDVEPCITRNGSIGEQLPLELIGGLFGREQQQRRPIGIGCQRLPDFHEATECLAAAGGSQKKARLHDKDLTAKERDSKAEFDVEVAILKVQPWRDFRFNMANEYEKFFMVKLKKTPVNIKETLTFKC
jgi:hypothetical protein